MCLKDTIRLSISVNSNPTSLWKLHNAILKWLQTFFRPGGVSFSRVLDSILPQVWPKHQSGFHWTQEGGGWQLSLTFSFQGSAQGSQVQRNHSQHHSPSQWPHIPAGGAHLFMVVSLPWIWVATALYLHGEVYRRHIILNFDSHLHRTVISCFW